MDKLKYLTIIFVCYLSPVVFAKTDFSRDIDEAASLLKRRQEQMRATKSEIEELKAKITNTELNRKKQETEFTLRLSKILLPLLHWPGVSFQKAQNSWILKDHYRFVLANMKTNLIHEPVTLIADSEKKLTDFIEYQSSLNKRLKEMFSHEELLALQLEELKMLEARNRKAKR